MKCVDELGISPMPWSINPMDRMFNIVWSSTLGTTEVRSIVATVNCNKANRCLISAAPEMYECLYKALRVIEHYEPYLFIEYGTSEFIGKCRDVLAKAAGEEKNND